ncbi:MAG TPA: glycosyltransferase [Candidatus Eremiobacteraceae bacterium]|nr:glycosyltransferase [Candidatus Eremiobacteraceae bacterium]
MRVHLMEKCDLLALRGVAGIDVTLVRVKLYLMECMAILGRREEPTDGVHDYCCYLRDALAKQGVNLALTQVRWAEIGRKASRQELLEAVKGKQNTFFLLQYTALSWSRRGFALPAVSVLKLLTKNGARCAVVFHDPDGYSGNRAVDRFRRGIQRYAMKRLMRLSDLAIFTLPRNKIPWLPADTQNFVFIPVGANLPAPERAWEEKRRPTGSKPIVAVFSLSDKPTLAKEVSQIARAVSNAAKQVGPLEVVVLGRNSESGGEDLRVALAGSRAEVRIVGVVPADEVVRILGASDVMLFARGPISSRRGSAIAGIACGLPVIAEEGSELAPPITEAGVVLVPEELVPEGFGTALVRVLNDQAYRASLAQRSRDAQSRYFSWSVIARQYAQAVRALPPPSRE